MNQLSDKILVTDIAGNVGRLQCTDPVLVKEIMALGFAHNGDGYSRKISDMDDRRTVVAKLVGLRALFSAGRDWSPAEIVALFAEEGSVGEKFRVITWKGPDDFLIEEHGPTRKN